MKKWIVGSTIAAAAIASVLFFSTYSLGTTRYVKSGLSCSNYDPATNACGGAGTATVYTSIAAAFSAGTTVAGDTLYIRAGTYTSIDGSTQTIPTGTSFANAPLISAYAAEVVTIQQYIGLVGTYIHYVIFQNLIIDGQSNANEVVNIGGGANHVRFTGCEIKNARHHGVANYNMNDGFNEFINCNIHHNGTSSGLDHGMYYGSGNNLIERCQVHHNMAFGIHQYNGYPGETSNNNTIRNNRVYNNGTGGFTVSNPQGILVRSGNNSVVYNNLVYANTGGGIDTNNGTGNRIYNNTIYGNVGQAYALSTAGGIVKNNIVYGNELNVVQNNGSSTVSNNLTTQNPLFVAAGSGDFHLATGSPAIGFGCANCGTELSSIFTTDFDDNARGTAPWDAGAFEYGAVSGDSMTINSPNPNGSDSWTIGSAQTISWTCIGCGAGVDIDISRNGGAFTSLADNTGGSSFSWTVTGPANTTNVIRIRDNDATPTQTSAVFAITSSGGGGSNPIISENTSPPKAGTIPGVSDAWMWQLSPDQNNNSDSGLYVNKYDATGHRHQLLKFDGLSQVPTGSTITSATLGIYVTGGANGTATPDAISQTWDVRRLLRNWDKTQATWNVFSTGNAWTTAGGLGAGTDRVSTPSAQILNVTSTTPGFFTVTSTSTAAGTLLDDVIKVVNGTYSNFGWHLERNGAGNDTASRNGISSEGTNGQRPYLELIYTTAVSTIVVTEPKAGDLFLAGQQGPIRWGSQGISGTVNIDLSRDGGTTWENLTTAGYSQADVTVTYNAPTSSNCKIRVVSGNDPTVVGTSTVFRIGGTRAGFLLLP